MCLSWKDEFKLSNFGFKRSKRQHFYKSQWGLQNTTFILLRSAFLIYMVAWLIWQVVDGITSQYFENYQSSHYLTNWVNVMVIIYFLLSLAVTIHEVLQDKLESSTQQFRSNQLQWFHWLMWTLFNCSFVFSIIVDVVYWSVIAGVLPPSSAFHPQNVHLHLVNILFLTTDLCIGSLEVRILHFVHAIVFGFIYVFFALMLHLAGINSALYPILDWRKPGPTLGVIAGLGIVIIPLLQVLAFLVYSARVSVSKKYFHEVILVDSTDNCENICMTTS